MWIKICGITREVDILACVRAGVSAVGLNFYAPSPRSVSTSIAAQLARASKVEKASMERIGVFVNASTAEIVETVKRVDLTGVQLHGDEEPAVLSILRQSLPGTRLIRAFRVDETTIKEVDQWLRQCEPEGVLPDNVLIDARVVGEYGGTGATAPWRLLADYSSRSEWPPLILAGGLTAKNVRAGAGIVRPFGVDTASGVEEAPGVKSARQVAQFVAELRV